MSFLDYYIRLSDFKSNIFGGFLWSLRDLTREGQGKSIGVLIHPDPGWTNTQPGYLHLLNGGALVVKLNPSNVRFGLREPDVGLKLMGDL
jgi:hypothetical protein